MKITCPICNRINTTHPEALLGRIYVCDRCHHMLLSKSLQQGVIQWRPLAVSAAQRPVWEAS
ncbi:MAG: hypothetical protein PVJ53_02500 [Desulfobacterales bacterium]|jgi:uncharacterized protein YlaI